MLNVGNITHKHIIGYIINILRISNSCRTAKNNTTNKLNNAIINHKMYHLI